MLELAENVFLEESSVRFFGFRLRTRMTVIRLAGRRLFVHSPVWLTRGLRERLERLGEVSFIVSPNKLHHQPIGEWAEAYPEARVLASPGLVERRPDVEFDDELGDDPDPAWADEIDQAATWGNVFFSEIVFLHRATRTLVVTDLVENLERGTVSPPARLLVRAFGIGSRPVAAPEHRYYTMDAEAAAESFRRIRMWDFERIVLAHGGLIEDDAPAVFGRVCDDLLASAARRGRLARWVFGRMARIQ
jgi:hypothetical protein